jgi:hypothetical protein
MSSRNVSSTGSHIFEVFEPGQVWTSGKGKQLIPQKKNNPGINEHFLQTILRPKATSLNDLLALTPLMHGLPTTRA